MTISFATQSSLRLMNRPGTIDPAQRTAALHQPAPAEPVRGAGPRLGLCRGCLRAGPGVGGPAEPVRERLGECLGEDDDGLGRHGAVLGGNDGQDITARPPGRLRRAAAKPRQRIGETRAVHVKQHLVRARKTANSRNFIRCVHGSELRCLRYANGAHHMPVELYLLCDEIFYLAKVDLPVTGLC